MIIESPVPEDISRIPIMMNDRSFCYVIANPWEQKKLYLGSVHKQLIPATGSACGRPLLQSDPPRPENIRVFKFIGIFIPEKEEVKQDGND